MIKVFVLWVCKLAHWCVSMLLTIAAKGFQPELMIVSGVLGGFLSRDNIVLGRKKIIESYKDKEQVGRYIAPVLLIEHPFFATALNGLDLTANTLCCICVRRKYVNALRVSKSH